MTKKTRQSAPFSFRPNVRSKLILGHVENAGLSMGGFINEAIDRYGAEIMVDTGNKIRSAINQINGGSISVEHE